MATSEHLTTAQLDELRALWDAMEDDGRAGVTTFREWKEAALNHFPALLAMARRVAELEAENARLRAERRISEEVANDVIGMFRRRGG